MKKVYILLYSIMLLTIVFTSPCFAGTGWLIYHKPEFKGKVIDSETKEPIEGTAVVVTYTKHPIVSGPAGGNSSIIHIKEALTDKNGEFHIPSYTTLISPNSKEDRADFIIYKPGYASYPHRRVYPLDYCGPEYLFSKELGDKGKIHRNSEVISITHGIVELPPLKTRKERLKGLPGHPSVLTPENSPVFFNILNEESKNLGLELIE
jgi:hypothetical protein